MRTPGVRRRTAVSLRKAFGQLLCVFPGVAALRRGQYGKHELVRPQEPGPAGGCRRPAGSGASSDLDAQGLVTINALGRKCPIPIIMLAEQIRDVPVGGIIAVLADDPAAYTDVPAWCTMKSHECVFRTDLPSGWSFGIRRRY
jgi:tRNA 2-thiouridine synthesizing protein A